MPRFGIFATAFATAMRKLKEELGIGRSHGTASLEKPFEKSLLLVVVKPQTSRGDTSVGTNSRCLNDHQSRSGSGKLLVVRDEFVTAHSFTSQTATHRRHANAVRQRLRPHL